MTDSTHSSHAPRQTWSSTWLSLSFVIAKRSLCVRDQVGCVIISSDNRIVSTGYNGPPRGFDHNDLTCESWCHRAQAGTTDGKSYDDCPSLHAEANALMMSETHRRAGGTAYVSSSMCFGCAKLIANSGITQVVMPAIRGCETHRSPDVVDEFLHVCGIGVTRVTF